jgi:transmembrane sensor
MKEKLRELLSKYQQGLCTDEELKLLEQWLAALEQSTKDETVFENAEEMTMIRERMRNTIHQQLHPETPPASYSMGIGYYFLSVENGEKFKSTAENSIVKWDTISTTDGKIKKVILNDSSTIFLSANSQVRIAAGFSKNHRKLELLSGEAWFDVIKNPLLPFTVKSGDLQTIVLGTQFTMTAYPGLKKMEVHVSRGKVKVQEHDQVQQLVAGESVKYNLIDKSLTRTTPPVVFDPENHRYILNDCSFDELAMRIKSIFGYTLISLNNKITSRHYTGEIKINQNVHAALSKFLEIHHHKFEITGKEVRML